MTIDRDLVIVHCNHHQLVSLSCVHKYMCITKGISSRRRRGEEEGEEGEEEEEEGEEEEEEEEGEEEEEEE